ncbi:MAG: metK [Chlamydiales bacterium]|jgi:S-adenosylmethionine synthetase|nr:metK [Chlamydiales bacterium]
MAKILFTSESVARGHPDKIADQISDAVLDHCLLQDPNARVACEVLVSTGLVVMAGEITTTAQIDYQQIARETIKEIGYNDSAIGFDYRSCGVICTINKQSPDIAQGVNEQQALYGAQGAGDQGLMFGFACDETDSFMPLPISLAHGLTNKLLEARISHKIPYLRPDGKTQVTVEYNEMHLPIRVDAVVISTQHQDVVTHAQITKDMKELAYEVIPQKFIDKDTRFFVNPTGRFVQGGPAADCGLTGRKIIVDSYGGMGRHGGGAFSGKDPSKVDRSACYAARYVAKNIIAAKLAKRCEIQVSYAIGVPYPVSLKVDTFGTGLVEEKTISQAITEVFDLSPKGIIEMLQLKRPIYRQTAYGGHFGRNNPDFYWERTDKIDDLLVAIKRLKR